jgi:hypothetical protein
MAPTKTDHTAGQRAHLLKLGRHRQKVDKAKQHLDDLYAEQNQLYVEGNRLGLPATDMARAIGATPDKVASGAEAIRQVIRRDGPAKKAPAHRR